MFFPPPFAAFNVGERWVGMAGGFRLFTGDGTGGADLLPEGEGVARGGALRESRSDSDRMVCGAVISYIPIESFRVGYCGRSCVGGVLSDGSRPYLDELLEATATFGKLLELSVLALRMVFPLRSSTGGRRFSTLLADFNDFGLAEHGSRRLLSGFAADPGFSSCIKSTTGVLGIGVVFLSWTHHSPPRQRSTRRLVVGLTSRILALLTRDSSASFICERLYGVERSWVFVRRG
jgi:hypothetical protein